VTLAVEETRAPLAVFAPAWLSKLVNLCLLITFWTSLALTLSTVSALIFLSKRLIASRVIAGDSPFQDACFHLAALRLQ
jgi:hypothetical protein